MEIAFYAPFKPLGHQNPSGDLVIARGLVKFLEEQGHKITVQTTLRARWIYFKPWLWPQLIRDLISCLKKLHQTPPDVWLTYHTYYKAPDLLGPWVCGMLGIKYVIFQGIYSTKRKRRLKTLPGFYLNRAALVRADHIFSNKLSDLKNLKRLIPEQRLTYIKPGIKLERFKKNNDLSEIFRKKWKIPSSCPVILTAAMFRDDVKTQGLSWLLKCCANLAASKLKFHLVIAGSGKMEDYLKSVAQTYLPGCYTFTGKIARQDMAVFYGSGDMFAFPGIRESLGMVYLEAQSCALPVVAFKNGGIPEVVVDKKTGYLIPMYDCRVFSDILTRLLTDPVRREKMGMCAVDYVRAHHDRDKNYKKFEKILYRVAG